MIIDFSRNNGGGGGEYVLPKATADVLGGIKVGENLSIDANGVLSAVGGGDSTKLEAVSELPQTANQGDVVAFYGNNGGIRTFSNGEDVTTLKFIVPLDTFILNFKMKHVGEDLEWNIEGIKFVDGNFVSVGFAPWSYEEKDGYILIRGAWADTGMKVYRGSYLGYEGVIFENANDDDNYRYYFTKMENPYGTILEIPLGSLTEENYNNQILDNGSFWGCPMRQGDPGVEIFGGPDAGFHSIYDYVDSWTTIGGVEVFYNSENSRFIFRKQGLSWRNGASEEAGRYDNTIYCVYQEEGEEIYGVYQRQGEEWKALGEGGQGGGVPKGDTFPENPQESDMFLKGNKLYVFTNNYKWFKATTSLDKDGECVFSFAEIPSYFDGSQTVLTYKTTYGEEHTFEFRPNLGGQFDVYDNGELSTSIAPYGSEITIASGIARANVKMPNEHSLVFTYGYKYHTITLANDTINWWKTVDADSQQIVSVNEDSGVPRWDKEGRIVGKESTNKKSIKFNGTGYNKSLEFYTTNNPNIPAQIYVPSQGGTEGQILMSNGDAEPIWINKSDVTNGVSFAKLTQDEYDALEVKDPNTLYIIIED